AKVFGDLKVPSPLPTITPTQLLTESVTARSAMPSPLKSPTATPATAAPSANVVLGPKAPLPRPTLTESLPAPEFTEYGCPIDWISISSLPAPVVSDTAATPVSGPTAVGVPTPAQPAGRAVKNSLSEKT